MNTTANYNDRIIQHDSQVWRVLSTGVVTEQGVFCHLASVHSFRQQANGKVPYQICDYVPVMVLDRGRTV
jgi:hypothetical protein